MGEKVTERRRSDRPRWRRDLILVAALVLAIVFVRDAIVEQNATDDDRDQCHRAGVRVEVLYDFIGDAQNAWRGVRDNAEPQREEVKRILSSLGIPEGPQLLAAVGLFISPDAADNAQDTIDAYAKLRGRLRRAVSDDAVLPGHEVRVDCTAEFPYSFPASLFN